MSIAQPSVLKHETIFVVVDFWLYSYIVWDGGGVYLYNTVV